MIEQKVGHDAALDFTGILFLSETIPEQFRSVLGQLPDYSTVQWSDSSNCTHRASIAGPKKPGAFYRGRVFQ
ncbi:hypothetical protein AK973_4452 [Pseudomonas brassicacearum]|nr:hypothetical protein AK973_4452 [Pseudomonas brassicacearum]